MNKKYDPRSDLSELMHILEERIAEYHDVPGKQAERHAFVLYRDKVMKIWVKCGGADGDNA